MDGWKSDESGNVEKFICCTFFKMEKFSLKLAVSSQPIGNGWMDGCMANSECEFSLKDGKEKMCKWVGVEKQIQGGEHVLKEQ
jgi:hypothetical protein